jgi:hypothetical protein
MPCPFGFTAEDDEEVLGDEQTVAESVLAEGEGKAGSRKKSSKMKSKDVAASGTKVLVSLGNLQQRLELGFVRFRLSRCHGMVSSCQPALLH